MPLGVAAAAAKRCSEAATRARRAGDGEPGAGVSRGGGEVATGGPSPGYPSVESNSRSAVVSGSASSRASTRAMKSRASLPMRTCLISRPSAAPSVCSTPRLSRLAASPSGLPSP